MLLVVCVSSWPAVQRHDRALALEMTCGCALWMVGLVVVERKWLVKLRFQDGDDGLAFLGASSISAALGPTVASFRPPSPTWTSPSSQHSILETIDLNSSVFTSSSLWSTLSTCQLNTSPSVSARDNLHCLLPGTSSAWPRQMFPESHR